MEFLNMSWKNTFKHLLGRPPETKSSRTAPLLVQFGQHQPRFTPRQYDKLADEGYRKNVIAYRCIRLISQNAAAVPWIVYKSRGADKQPLDHHPLAALLQRPNPMQGGAELFESIFSFFLIAGNSYLETVSPAGAPPRELWALRPDRMRVIPGANGVPEAYRYAVGGKSLDFPVNPLTGQAQILHLKSFHPLDDWYGMSPLEAAAIGIDQHNDAARWNASLLQTSGRPSGALVYKPANADAADTLTEEQRQALKQELERYFSGPENAGHPLVLEGGLDWKEMSLSPKDMDWLAGKDVSAREIALAFHVPSQLIGVNGSLTFSNFEQARLAFFDDAVLPLLDNVKDNLNNWLAPQFGHDIHIDYDIDRIEALAPRRQQVWDRLMQSDFMTVNEKRQALSMKPIAGGDVLKGG
jgi:HK97 family phage portal protein